MEGKLSPYRPACTERYLGGGHHSHRWLLGRVVPAPKRPVEHSPIRGSPRAYVIVLSVAPLIGWYALAHYEAHYGTARLACETETEKPERRKNNYIQSDRRIAKQLPIQVESEDSGKR